MIEVGLVTFHKLFLIALAGHRNGSDSLTLAPMLGKSYPKGKSRQLSLLGYFLHSVALAFERETQSEV